MNTLRNRFLMLLALAGMIFHASFAMNSFQEGDWSSVSGEETSGEEESRISGTISWNGREVRVDSLQGVYDYYMGVINDRTQWIPRKRLPSSEFRRAFSRSILLRPTEPLEGFPYMPGGRSTTAWASREAHQMYLELFRREKVVGLRGLPRRASDIVREEPVSESSEVSDTPYYDLVGVDTASDSGSEGLDEVVDFPGRRPLVGPEIPGTFNGGIDVSVYQERGTVLTELERNSFFGYVASLENRILSVGRSLDSVRSYVRQSRELIYVLWDQATEMPTVALQNWWYRIVGNLSRRLFDKEAGVKSRFLEEFRRLRDQQGFFHTRIVRARENAERIFNEPVENRVRWDIESELLSFQRDIDVLNEQTEKFSAALRDSFKREFYLEDVFSETTSLQSFFEFSVLGPLQSLWQQLDRVNELIAFYELQGLTIESERAKKEYFEYTRALKNKIYGENGICENLREDEVNVLDRELGALRKGINNLSGFWNRVTLELVDEEMLTVLAGETAEIARRLRGSYVDIQRIDRAVREMLNGEVFERLGSAINLLGSKPGFAERALKFLKENKWKMLAGGVVAGAGVLLAVTPAGPVALGLMSSDAVRMVFVPFAMNIIPEVVGELTGSRRLVVATRALATLAGSYYLFNSFSSLTGQVDRLTSELGGVRGTLATTTEALSTISRENEEYRAIIERSRVLFSEIARLGNGN